MIRQASPDLSPGLDLNVIGLFGLLRRERRKAALIVMAVLGLSLGYAIFAPRTYLSSAEILVATRPKSILASFAQDIEAHRGVVDPGLIESQVEILRSSSVVLAVVRKLHLPDDDLFMDRDRWNPLRALSHAVAWVLRANPEGDATRLAEQAAVRAISDRLKVKRAGMTYVVDVQYAGRTPELAFKIVNALSDEYIQGELQAKYDNSRRANDWFRARLLDLEKDVADADHEVQRYRAANNIVDTSRGRLDEQQLTEMSVQLAVAQSATAAAKARYERAAAVLGADLADSTLSEALKSEAIAKLREQYVRLTARRRELTLRFGADHRLVLDVARERDETARAGQEEMQRLAQADKNDLEIAASHESQLLANIQKLVARFAELNDSQVTLRKLESSVKVFRNVYDASLEKFQINAQEQAAPIEIARVITPANYPDRAAWPQTPLVMLAGLALGGLAAVAAVVAQEATCDRFRFPADVRDHANLPCLGELPRLNACDLAPLTGASGLGGQSPLARIAVSDPVSPYARAVRDVKLSIDLTMAPGECVTIGILSTCSGEGKTTLAANLALLTAKMGRRTLLIDGDLHSFRLSTLLAPAARFGLLQALAYPDERANFCATDAPTGLRFLPAVASGRLYNAAEILRSRSMERTLAAARAEFDYVFVDLPALQSDIDARAAAALFDGFVYLIERGATRRSAVREALAQMGPASGRIVGAVLNMATAA